MDNRGIENIVPSVDLRKNYPKMSKLCKEAPIIVTVNGRADTVLMSHRKFLELQAELILYERFSQAEEDVRLGRTRPADDVYKKLEQDLREAAENGEF